MGLASFPGYSADHLSGFVAARYVVYFSDGHETVCRCRDQWRLYVEYRYVQHCSLTFQTQDVIQTQLHPTPNGDDASSYTACVDHLVSALLVAFGHVGQTVSCPSL